MQYTISTIKDFVILKLLFLKMIKDRLFYFMELTRQMLFIKPTIKALARNRQSFNYIEDCISTCVVILNIQESHFVKYTRY